MFKRLQHPKAMSPEDLTMSFKVDDQWYTMPMNFRPMFPITNREIVSEMAQRGFEWVREGNFLVLYG